MKDNSAQSPNRVVLTGRGASARQRTLQRGSVLAAAATAAVLGLAGCGGGSHGSSTSRGSANSQLLAYSACVRSHGVPNFPDPDSSGRIRKMTPEQLGVSSSQLQAAESSCGYLLQPTQAQEQQVTSGMLDFARCMRSHGVPNWPDPTFLSGAPGTDGANMPVFNIPGIDPNSPQVSNAADACMHLLVQSTNGHPTTIELCNGVGEDGRCHGYGNPNS
jgi:hypothetical protein